MTPLEALADYLFEVIRATAANAAAKSAAPALGATMNIDESEAAKHLSDLIGLGINSGEVRTDLTVTDVYLLVTGSPSGAGQHDAERWAELVLPCISATAAAMNIHREPSTTTG